MRRRRNPEQIRGNFIPSGKGNFDSRYWEWVPTPQLWKFAEHRGDRDYDSEANVQKLMRSLLENGWQDVLILTYCHSDKTATLSEGNHRYEAAQRLGLAFVPVRAVLAHNEDGQYHRKVHGFTLEGHVPADLLPSQIGLTGYRDSEFHKLFKVDKEPV